MLTAIFQLLAGTAFLWFAGDALVRAAASLALRHGVSRLVIGLTIVAAGTSAPELFVSVLAAWQGKSDIALGNVIGSNIANIGLVLGITALLKPLGFSSSLLKKEIPFLILTTLTVFVMSANNILGLWEGLTLLSGVVIFMVFSLKSNISDDTQSNTDLLKSSLLEWLYLVLGTIGLAYGSSLFVDGAASLARLLGVSELFIGLSIVAVGTSLPEMAASLIALLRRQNEIAAGNLIGSNIFNLLLILGSAAAIQPFYISNTVLQFDFIIMIFLTIILLPMAAKTFRISRLQGFFLLLIYVFYIAKIAIRG